MNSERESPCQCKRPGGRPTVLALRLDDPGGLFSSGETNISDDVRSILKAHYAVVHGAPHGPEALIPAPCRIKEDLASPEDIDAAGPAKLREFARRRFVAVFQSETDALHRAVAIQQRASESLQGSSKQGEGGGTAPDRPDARPYYGGEARLQCVIGLAHEKAPRSTVERIRSKAQKLLQRTPSESTSGAQEPSNVGEAVALIGPEGPASGGSIVCTGTVYQELPQKDMRLLYEWEEAREPAPRRLNRDYVLAQIKRPFSAVKRFMKGAGAPMECIYDDAQVLLNAPFERTFSAEVRGWIKPRRGARPDGPGALLYPERPHPKNELVGLALSGGGMRSGVFSLGAVQALARYGVLEDVDYLSTVSGGGYFGAALSALWADPLPYDDLPQLNATPEHFPFAYPRPPSDGGPRAVHGNESPALKYVRGNAKLFGSGIGLFNAGTWSDAGRFLVSMMLLWTVFLLPTITLPVLGAIGVRNGFQHLRPHVDWQDPWWIALALIPAAPAILAVLLSAVAWRVGDRGRWRERLCGASIGSAIVAALLFVPEVFGAVTLQPSMEDVWTRHWLVTLAAVSPLVVFGVYALISFVVENIRGERTRFVPDSVRSVLLPTSAVLTFVLLLCAGVWGFDQLWNGTIARYVTGGAGVGGATVGGFSLSKLWDARLKDNKRVQRAILQIGLAVGGYFVLGLVLSAWSWFLWSSGAGSPGWVFHAAWAAAGGLVLLGLCHPVSRGLLNRFSLSRTYAAMIQKSWVVGAVPKELASGRPGADTEEAGDLSRQTKAAHWTRVWPRPDITMHTLREKTAAPGKVPPGPYHLVCTALNLPGSTSAKLLDRRSDSFVIAPIHSGSALTRWRSTEGHDELDGMPLAQAAAISGAAISPNMGGRTTRTLSIILTLLNVRLGRWMRNPRPSTNTLIKKVFVDAPLVLYWKEMLGLASHEDGQIYLSDGGHFDNLGLYELLRRRCKYIVAVSADVGALEEAFDMGNLGRALRLARVDFGVEVDMGPLAPLMHDPTTGEVGSLFAAGEITYPSGHGGDSEKGTLIFIKSGIVNEELTADLLSYWKNEHPAFPYDSTTDQQYDQPQFESYRQLGYIAARAMWNSVDVAPGGDTRGRLTRIADKYSKTTAEQHARTSRSISYP